jgi:hypothetical protein
MFNLKRSLLILTSCLSINAFSNATPSHLITHNTTDLPSNSYIDGASVTEPTKPHSDKKVAWAFVKMICFGHTTNNQCEAEIRLLPEGKAPIVLGKMSVNLSTGEILPAVLTSEGYQLKVVNLGEVTLSKITA